MLSLGIDVGTSSVKVSVYDPETGQAVASASHPETELPMLTVRPGWAEQEPGWWWDAFVHAYHKAMTRQKVDPERIRTIGIAYQMHGLVCLDGEQNPLRPSIIWCDSRAVKIGEEALKNIGRAYAFRHLLNSPGNFTASKLAWVKENEPKVYASIDKICLPGDYIAYRLTGDLTTTISGMSEGVFFDFESKTLSEQVLAYFGFNRAVIPEMLETFDHHGTISPHVAEDLGLSRSAKVTYKAGDQPNNAFALNVLKAGEVAATAGTSGVVYCVTDRLFIDPTQKVNSFAHVNYTPDDPRIGILLCVNGTGSANAWAKRWTDADSYMAMNTAAAHVPPGSEGLHYYPFGNGAERMLGNKPLDARLTGIRFNTHSTGHLYRAVQEGIAYAIYYGMEAFYANAIRIKVIRAGDANLFQSRLFGNILSALTNVPIELYNTDGALGAARGALVGGGYLDVGSAFSNLQCLHTIQPDKSLRSVYLPFYEKWKFSLNRFLQASEKQIN